MNAAVKQTSADFLPFGEEIAPDETYRKTDHKYGKADRVRQKFTGYQNDAETGLDFAEARMYENRHGRFTAVDPFSPMLEFRPDDEDNEEDVEQTKQKFEEYLRQPQHWNRYLYTLNNPLLYVDRDGEIPVIPVALVIIRFAPAAITAARYLASTQGQRAIQSAQRQGVNLTNFTMTNSGAISNNVFKLTPFLRGNVIEGLMGVSDKFARGFPVIDDFVRRGGVATSIKSLDIFAQSYRNLNQLSSTLTRYVNQLEKFQAASRNGIIIRQGDVQRRILQVVLPRGDLSFGQRSVLLRVQQDAARRGVEIVYVQAR